MEPRDLSAHVPYEAGRGVEEVARELGLDSEDLVKLSSNENPFGPAPSAVEAVREHAPSAHRYPKSAATARSTVSPGRYWVPATRCWCRRPASPTTR